MNNRARLSDTLARARAQLGPLADQALLVGGCVPTQYELGPIDVRATDDIDLVFGAHSYADWQDLAQRLNDLGFAQPDADGSLARFVGHSLFVDVATVPYVDAVGFNPWYEGAIATRMRSRDGWWVPTPVYFVATKFQAFNDPGREGHGDPIGSRDIEDVINVLRGRPDVFGAIETRTDDVHRFVRFELARLVGRADALDIIQAHFEGDDAAQSSAQPLLNRLRVLVGGGA